MGIFSWLSKKKQITNPELLKLLELVPQTIDPDEAEKILHETQATVDGISAEQARLAQQLARDGVSEVSELDARRFEKQREDAIAETKEVISDLLRKVA